MLVSISRHAELLAANVIQLISSKADNLEWLNFCVSFVYVRQKAGFSGFAFLSCIWLSWQLLHQDMPELQAASSLRTSITPTKKIEMGRTIMPDGTIVTTVTTIQSRPKLDCKLGKIS